MLTDIEIREKLLRIFLIYFYFVENNAIYTSIKLDAYRINMCIFTICILYVLYGS